MDFNTFITFIINGEDKRFEETDKAIYFTIKKDFVPFKMYYEKKSRKVCRGNSSLVEIILSNKVIILTNFLLHFVIFI